MNVEAYIQSGAVEAYVLGLMDAAETAAMEQLLKEHMVLRRAVEDFALQLERKLKADALDAPASVRTQLEQRLFPQGMNDRVINEDDAEEVVSDEETDEPGGRVVRYSPNWLRFAASVLLLMLMASLWANVVWYRKTKQTQALYNALAMQTQSVQVYNTSLKKTLDQVQAHLEAVSDAGTQAVVLNGQAGFEQHRATVYMNYRTRQLMVVRNNLPPLQSTQVYQLWAFVNGKPISAGLLSDCAGKLCTAKPILGNVGMYAISVEAAGPEKAAPAGEVCALGKVSG